MKTISASRAIIWACYLKFNVPNCDNPKGHSSPYEQRFFGEKELSMQIEAFLSQEFRVAVSTASLGNRS